MKTFFFIESQNESTVREEYLRWKRAYYIAKDKLNKGIVNIYDQTYGFLVRQYDPEEDKENQKAVIMFNLYSSLMKKYNLVPYPEIKPEKEQKKRTARKKYYEENRNKRVRGIGGGL